MWPMGAKPEGLPRDPDLAKFIYDMLRDLHDAGMKQQEMSEKTGVSKATISNILTKRGAYGVGREMATDLGKLRGLSSYDEVLDAAYSERLAPKTFGSTWPTSWGSGRCDHSRASRAQR